MEEAIAGATLALASAIIGGIVVLLVQAWMKGHSNLTRLRFEIYMKLLMVRELQFWSVTWEVNDDDVDSRILQRKHDYTFQIADLLRRADRLSEMEEIIRTLFSVTYGSEKERQSRLDELIRQLGEKVNPRYNRSMNRVMAENQEIAKLDSREYMRRLFKLRGF